jgi:hypothetical protein
MTPTATNTPRAQGGLGLGWSDAATTTDDSATTAAAWIALVSRSKFRITIFLGQIFPSFHALRAMIAMTAAPMP